VNRWIVLFLVALAGGGASVVALGGGPKSTNSQIGGPQLDKPLRESSKRPKGERITIGGWRNGCKGASGCHKTATTSPPLPTTPTLPPPPPLPLPPPSQQAACAGYPEQRAYLASQTWWDDGETLSGGATRHVHAETCFPLAPTVVSGDVRLDVIVKMHNEQGRYLTQVRIDVDSDQDAQVRYSTPTGNPRCDAADCTFTVPVTVPTDSLGAGKWEWRVGAATAPLASNSDSVPNRSLATNGWQVCVRSCSGRTPANDRLAGRGWYRDDLLIVRGYIEARFGWESGHDAEAAQAAYGTVGGTWCPPLRTQVGSQGDGPEPVERSFVSVDPDFHHGSPGRVYRDVAGTIQERVCIDTTQLANGPHKLFWETYTSSIFTGQLWGAQVLPFTVAN